MAKMRKIKVTDGKVSNLAIFDGEDIPDWADAAGWIDAPDGVGIDHTDNGDGTYEPPVEIELTATERDAAAQELTDMDMQSPIILEIAETLLPFGFDKDLFRVALKKRHRDNMRRLPVV